MVSLAVAQGSVVDLELSGVMKIVYKDIRRVESGEILSDCQNYIDAGCPEVRQFLMRR